MGFTGALNVPTSPSRNAGHRLLQMQFSLPWVSRRVPLRQLAVFSRQLSTLAGAGIPLLRALRTLANQRKPGLFRGLLEEMANDIETGSTFSEALVKHPEAFPALFPGMVKAGEAAGALESVLQQVAALLEKRQSLKRKLLGALVYPAVVTCAALAIVTFVTVFIVPVFSKMFLEMHQQLPSLTVFLMLISKLMRSYWYVPPAAVVVLATAWRSLQRLDTVRMFIDRLKLKLLLFGPLLVKMAVVRFARTLATLLAAGMPLLEALAITRDISDNETIAHALTAVRDRVREGGGIAETFDQLGIFPRMVTDMIQVGEETGTLDTMLDKVAESYEEEVDMTVAGLTSLLEPVLLIGMGVMVGVIVIALFLPLIRMSDFM